MIAKNRRPYFVIFQDEALELGADAALLLAELRYLEKHLKKDDHGYFRVDNSHIQEMVGFKKDRLASSRAKLIKAKKIDYIQGRNQNMKSRYRVIVK